MRERKETWHGPDEEAQKMLAEKAIASWTVWVEIARNDVVSLQRTRPFTLSEELVADARRKMMDLAVDMVGGQPWPVDIDEWRTRYDPIKALELRLSKAGYDPSKIPLSTREALAQIMDVYFYAVVFFHGTTPGLLY